MLLDREGLLTALRTLDEELAAAWIRGEVFIVGGAAMALAYDARRATVDVDGIFVPAAEVRMAAARVAERLDLERDWLNDSANAFMPGPDPERIGVFEGINLSVAAASPRYLLAMKLLAARAERDQDDIRILYELCGFTTAGEGLDLVESAYPNHVIAPRVQFSSRRCSPARRSRSTSRNGSKERVRDRSSDVGRILGEVPPFVVNGVPTFIPTNPANGLDCASRRSTI